MIEIFAGAAVLCSVAKQLGMKNSIAVDKVKKQNARSTVYQLNLRGFQNIWCSQMIRCSPNLGVVHPVVLADLKCFEWVDM